MNPLAAPLAPGSARLEAAIRDQQQRIVAVVATLGDAGTEDVHAARVAARRLRSMLKTFRPLLDERRVRRYRADLRLFARALGSAREADVRRELLLKLAADDAAMRSADRQRLSVMLDDACVAARAQLSRNLAEPGWARLGKALQRDAAGSRLIAVRDAELADVARIVAHAWRRPVKLLRRKPASTAELHELRLAFKHCRYALEPIADLSPKAAARLLRRLRRAQERIGEHRDTLQAEQWVRDNERTLGRALVTRLGADLQGREAPLRRQSAARAGRVLDAWRTWRDATRRLRKAGNRDRP